MKNESVSVSVIIPVFNREEEIGRAIDSILNQSVLPEEVIIADDCSSDNTLLRVNTYKSKCDSLGIRLIILTSSINKGPSHQRNRAWDLASSDFVCFLDSDDSFHKDKIRLFKRDLKKEPCIKLWTSRYTYLNEKLGRSVDSLKTIPFYKQLLSNYVSCSCAVVSGEVKERFNEDMKYCEDYELFTRLVYKYGLYFNESFLTFLHRKLNSKGGLSADLWKMRKGELKMYLLVSQYNRYVFCLLPFLFLFSLGKHLKKLLAFNS